MIAYVKSAAPIDADTPVMVAGDPERQQQQQRSQNGIDIDSVTWEELLIAAETVGIARADATAIVGITL